MPASIIVPPEGEQKMEERQPRRRGSRVGSHRRQTDGEACGQQKLEWTGPLNPRGEAEDL